MPAVSIITPAYRAQAHIARAVKSVLAQTMTSWEMVIASDDQTDYRQCLMEQGIEDKRLVFTTTGGTATGISSARNAAMRAASSDIIAMLDADDAFYPTKMEVMVPLAKEHGFCVCPFDYVRYRHEHRELISRIGMTSKDMLLDASTYLNVHYSANAMMVVDRSRMRASWREDLPAMEDLTYSMSAFDYLPGVYHINKPLHVYVATPDSFSSSREAPARFIAAKKIILERMERGDLGIQNPKAIEAYRRFIIISLATEEEYAQKQNSEVTFTELLEKNLFG